MQSKHKNKKGFTLIEILIVISLVTIISFVTFSFFVDYRASQGVAQDVEFGRVLFRSKTKKVLP